MLEANHDAAHRDANAPLRRFRPEYAGPVSERSAFKSNRSSGGTIVVAVNNSLLWPGGDTRPFRAVMRFCRSFFTAFGLCCAIAGPVFASSISGQASVIDGDTIEVRGERIRLVSVDAPESRQTCLDAEGRVWRCGQQAALALSDMIGRSTVVCLSEGQDRYGRILGQCSLGSVSLSAWLVEKGWAVPYNDREGRHYPAARRAEDARRGIWAGRFERPSDWRKQNLSN